MSHGGYHSLLEAINNGVPILGFPFFTDQYHNMAIAEKLGIGKRIDSESSIDELRLILREMLSNKRYDRIKISNYLGI